MPDHILKPKYKTGEKDGTGCSITDARIRNRKGLCGMMGCGQPLPDDTVPFMFGIKLCSECQQKYDELMSNILEK